LKFEVKEGYTFRMKNLGKYLPVFLFGLLLITNIFLWFAAWHEERGGILSVSVLDIGQGDAIFIEAPNGVQVLLDGGPDSSVFRELSGVMPFYDRSIDMLIVSNPDKDHIAGFVDVLKRYDVGNEVEPGTLTATAVYTALGKGVSAEGLEPFTPKAGDRIVLDKKRGVILDVLFPDRDVSGLSTNDGSLIMKLTYGQTCFMLTGDTTKGVEEYLVELYGEKLDCDVLKVAHHGSRTSSSPGFVSAVSPEYAVISSGQGNSYGHPHQETLDTLNVAGAKILRTDELGTITLMTDGIKLWQK